MPSLRTKLLKNFDELSLEIDQNVGGLIWIGDQPLAKHPKPFEWLDYLFNLSISKSLNQHQSIQENHNEFFFVKSFDKSLSLFFLEEKEINSKNQSLQDYLKFIEKTPTVGKEVKLITSKKNLIPSKLQAKIHSELIVSL